jgi:hypothetical protein
MKVLGSCEAQHTIQITAEDDAAIPPAELRRLAGDAAGGGKLPATMPAAATAGGRGEEPPGVRPSLVSRMRLASDTMTSVLAVFRTFNNSPLCKHLPPSKGVAFLLAGAGAVPGGSTMLLQLASHLRRAGYFVVAALTRPFDFEGRRRLEEADALIEAMCDVAQLTVRVVGWFFWGGSGVV